MPFCFKNDSYFCIHKFITVGKRKFKDVFWPLNIATRHNDYIPSNHFEIGE